jgi:hypothetical protein
VAVHAAIVVAPATAYLYLAHADWAWLYLVDPRRVPRLFVVPAVAAAVAALFGGYYGMGRMIAARVQRRLVLGALGGGLAVWLVLALLLGGRLVRYGSYEAYHRGHTAALFEVKLGFVLVALLAAAGAASAYLAFEIWRDGRRAHARLP